MDVKKVVKCVLSVIVVVAWCALNALGQASSSHCGTAVSTPVIPEGPSGLNSGSTPEPGAIDGVFNLGYNGTDRIDDSCGHRVPGWKADITVSIIVFSWRTHLKFLGAEYGWALVTSAGAHEDLNVPVGVNPITGQVITVNDQDSHITVDPVLIPVSLAWKWGSQVGHFKRFEANISVGEQFPTETHIPAWIAAQQGNFAQPGFGRFTTTVGFGGTWNISPNWQFSLENHYDFHHHQITDRYTQGQEYHNEWGFSRAITKDHKPIVILGPVGFNHWMVTESHGPGVVLSGLTPDVRPRGSSLGFQVVRPIPKLGLTFVGTYQNIWYGYSFGLGYHVWATLIYNIKRPERKPKA